MRSSGARTAQELLKDLADEPWDGPDVRPQVPDESGAVARAPTIAGTMMHSDEFSAIETLLPS